MHLARCQPEREALGLAEDDHLICQDPLRFHVATKKSVDDGCEMQGVTEAKGVCQRVRHVDRLTCSRARSVWVAQSPEADRGERARGDTLNTTDSRRRRGTRFAGF